MNTYWPELRDGKGDETPFAGMSAIWLGSYDNSQVVAKVLVPVEDIGMRKLYAPTKGRKK